MGGQKVTLERPRVRDVRNSEVPLGSYEVLQQASLMEEAVWRKIMGGLTTRRYGEVVRELETAYGIEKSTVSEHLVEVTGSGWKTDFTRTGRERVLRHDDRRNMLRRAEGRRRDRPDFQGHKKVLGLQQGATENVTVVKHLLDDIERRGVEFDVPRLYVIDGGKALHAAVKKKAGKCALIQRCQIHKIRNVVDHLTEDFQSGVRYKMRCAYSMADKTDARRALDQLHVDLMHLNPSAARSLEEGMDETLTMHRLRLPPGLRRTLSSTNLIESAFSTVETVCRNVKRWHGGDQYLRWVASALIWAESRWNRIHGYKELPLLVKELELAVVKGLPLRQAIVA